VSSVSAGEIARAHGLGACVGRPVAEIAVKIIAPADGPLATLADARELPRGEIGEIIVRGPVVTKTYDALPEATAAAKIAAANIQHPTSNAEPQSRLDANLDVGSSMFDVRRSTVFGAVWHRMGDCGYLDADGRLWFCGRKAERVETTAGTLHTEPCEQVFRAHPRAARCALIGLGERGRQRAALVVEARPANAADAGTLARELRALARQHAPTAPIALFFFHPQFPVDVRHNAKIHRLTLAAWAATAKGYAGDPAP
jgi:acyl-CoA synthetase (AMP-forming)/AMP-acid ligase II